MQVNLNIETAKSWLYPHSTEILISGPCSAESEEQMLTTAKAIAAQYPSSIFRAGVWKPRTRPNAFEGYGTAALEWLQTVKKEVGMRIATEVANAKHVEEALKFGVDILWIGARTTVNPFSVQEIADELKGVDVPVLVKNPVNPDLQLWVGALERINQAGITKLGAIHRGFSPVTVSKYRNEPNWKMAIELKRLLPQLPIICDPSHIAGNTELIRPVSQKAMDLEMDGLMIETHCNPAVALSDAKQQVTPAELIDLVESITLRKETLAENPSQQKLENLRKQIDKADEQLMELLAQRMHVVQEIGEWKRDNGITILQIGRWDELINERLQIASQHGLQATFVRKIFDAIHEESINRQTAILNPFSVQNS